MPQTKADKIFFEFTGGINTEVSPLTFPEGTSLDEENFELMPDGTRRRRRGVSLEDSGLSLDISDLEMVAGDAFSYHRWSNVAGNSQTNYVVVQIGSRLYVYEDSPTLSVEVLTDTIDLTDFATKEDFQGVSDNPVSFADGRGLLFVTGPFVQPFYVELDLNTLALSATQIDIRTRDFQGIDDGVAVSTQPTSLSTRHHYNLLNRGWVEENITQYHTDKSKYPAKNMIPWKGYRRLIDTAYAEADGDKEWNSTKLEQEVFGNSSAPQGALYINPFDTENSATDQAQSSFNITTWSVLEVSPPAEPDTDWLVTVTVGSAHGLSPGDSITISGNQYAYNSTVGTEITRSLNGTYDVVATPTGTTFTFNTIHSPNFGAFSDQFLQLGMVGEEAIPNPEGVVTDRRPTSVAWYGSRVFYGGVKNPEYNDILFFSQIVVKPEQVGRCYQENDPTAENLNQTLPTDGGTIQVPGLGGVLKMVPFGAALYVFGTLGVWEIGPGGDGFFSATNYAVRKVADIEAPAKLGIVSGDFGVVFTSPRGIYALVQDSNSGFVVPQSLSESRIQTLWNAIPRSKQNQVQCLFDSAQKRYYIFYTSDRTKPDFFYDKALVFDVLRGAWLKMKFPGTTHDHILGVMTIATADESAQNKKLKFVLQRDDYASIDIADMDHDNFLDWDETEQIPYLLTGYDNVGDFQRRRQAPVCHVYLKRTETGVVEGTDDELIPVNPSSVYLEARWDWADRDITGKFSSPQQVYRHVRMYQPIDLDDEFETGLPVVVTRNKIRGRGRALHLKFYGELGKDAHLIGWALQYAGVRSA